MVPIPQNPQKQVLISLFREFNYTFMKYKLQKVQ